MKKFITFLVVLALLLGASAFVIAKLVPVDLVETRAKEKFTRMTGRNIGYGSRSMTFWPGIGLRLRDVTVSNPAWTSEEHMLQLATLDIRLALMPLLDRRVEISRFVLEKPVIHLETSAKGEKSWELFTPPDKMPVDIEIDGNARKGSDVLKDFSFKLGEFEFKDGLLTYRDGRSGITHQMEDIDLALMLPDFESSMQMDGALTYKQKRVNIVLDIEKPMALGEGGSTPGSLNINTEDMNVKVAGVFATAGKMMEGKVDARISSLPGLLAWMGDGHAKSAPFKTVSFESEASVTATSLALEGASLALDDIQAGGNVSVNLGGMRPNIFARLSMDKIDLDRFASTASGGNAPGSGTGGKAAGQAKWDATPIDFSNLHAADADLILQTKGFSLKGADVGPSNLTVQLKNGRLDFKSSEASLFGGRFASDLTLTAAATPTMAFKFGMTDVQANPVLTTFADFDKLSGSVDADVSVTSSGASQKAIIEALNGKGAITFRNGSIQGIDLVNIAKMIQSKLSDMSIGQGKTDFVELGGTFTIAGGIAHNDDLKMKGPLVQATGTGDIDLPKKYVRYRLLPVLTASSAVEGAGGITVPVDIKGPFNNIKIKPDYKSVIKGALENPEEIRKTLRNVEDQIEPLKDNLKNFKKDPAKALESILGSGGLLGPKAAPPAEPAPQPEPSAPAPAQDSAP